MIKAFLSISAASPSTIVSASRRLEQRKHDNGKGDDHTYVLMAENNYGAMYDVTHHPHGGHFAILP